MIGKLYLPGNVRFAKPHLMIKLSDYVIRRLVEWGLEDIFLVTGGGAMHLNDSIGKDRRLRFVCTHHEQAAAIAAECYARVTGKTAVVNVTTGPGGVNALNGVFGAWTDSVPLLIISGQVKRETCMSVAGLTTIRQLGDQEVDIVRMVSGITKYAVMITDPNSIRYHLERAYHLTTSGRPGPCWLDIPIDVQSTQIDEDNLVGYNPAEDDPKWDAALLKQQCKEIVEKLSAAKRPVILAGTGIRAAGTLDEFESLIRKLQIPVTTAWTHDLIATSDRLFCGRPGTIGERAGNFTVQNADVLLILGSRLNIRQISYNWQSFARHAYKIQVDVDEAELHKPTVHIDLPIHSDLRDFLPALIREADRSWTHRQDHADWLVWCKERVAKYPAVQPKHRLAASPINTYDFVDKLFECLGSDDVVVLGNAAACIVPYQAAALKKGQRLISNSGSASMGYDLPAAIGAAVANKGGRVICLAGDGSLQFNIQELQTIVHHGWPLKLLVLNNGGYLSIRQSQSNFFSRMVGESAASGVSFPDYVKVGKAYGIDSCRIGSVADLPRLWDILELPGPALCEILLDPAQEFEPRLKSRQLPDGSIVTPALEDMFPFLSAEELDSNLLFKRT